MALKKIVILGGGYGGIEAAKKLDKSFKKNKEIEITLIDKNPFHTLMTELHEAAGYRVSSESVRISFNRIFAGSRIRVVLDNITNVDIKSRTLKGDSGEVFNYDYLIMGTGAEPHFFNIPGAKENSYTLWSYDDALKLKERIDNQFLKAARENNPEKRKKNLTFTIAGGGFTGVEMAGELVERRKSLCTRYNLDENDVSIIIIEGLPGVCSNIPEKLQKKALFNLEKKNVKVFLNSFIESVEDKYVSVKGSSEKIYAETFIWTAGVKGSTFCESLEFDTVSTDRRHCANSFLQSPEYKNIYFVGDNLFFLENGKPLPKIVETALQTAHIASYNIIADIEGKPKKEFKSNYHGFMISIGSSYAVAHVSGISMSGFPAMAVKHLVNLHYLFGLAGVNALWGYLQHEILNIKERRSLVGEMGAYKIPNYWTLPLRLLLGGMWLYEGIKKVAEGWLNPGAGGIFNPSPTAVRLPGVRIGGADAVAAATDWAGDAANTAAAQAAPAVADAVAAATEWAGAAANAAGAQAAPAIADAVAAATEWAGAAGEAASVYGKPLMEALGAYTWFAENILSAFPSLAFILQASVVLAEIAIGLALIGGLFTFLAAGVSILLGIMFIFSGWGNPELLWYIAAAFVMLGGGGRGLGLDHWVIPFIKNWWNGNSIAHRTHLYLDEPVIKKNRN